MDARKTFHDSVTPLPVATGSHQRVVVHEAGEAHGDEVMPLHFSLELPADAAAHLEDAVASGTVVAPQDLHSTFAVPREKAQALADWLRAEGFEVTGISRDGTSVYAHATVRQIQKSLGVNMVRVTRDGITHTAARNAPSLPADVGEGVHAIVGLQPFRKPHKHGRMRAPVTDAAAPAAASAPSRPPYHVQDLLRAYNAASLGVTGAGQTIAILIDTVPSNADLQAFWEQNGLPADLGRIDTVNVNQMTLPAPEGEETIDVEWASGIAPGARIRVYASGSLEYPYLLRALDQILEDLPSQPGMRQLSMSFGMGETYMGGSRGEAAAQHQKFLKLAAAGVNVFVSTGDAGSNPDSQGRPNAGPTQVQYAASDPAVIGVGGTTLMLSADGTVSDETGWTGSGGGESTFFTRPAWQGQTGVPGTQRLVPDVSLAADPDPGGFLVFNGRTLHIGGTSWSAPMWAALCALMNEARSKAGRPPLPFLNPLLYPLGGTPCFRDIQQGSNGAYNAGKGYDMVTGLGVPDVAALVDALP